ncbi:hypothetical protein EDB83DRAFT_2313078 [Lactarius deliciosus]|nr:hypothetical protein EDB83DRAFT_2313078 [Lactarius deliciosus]
MLTLEPGSLCDVCADEFSPRNLPHCIPCVQFASFVLTSTDPAAAGAPQEEAPIALGPPLIEDDFPNDLLLKASAPNYSDFGEARARDGRVLESKVARVASKKCSVEEVTALQQEVDRWLTEVTAADASSALYLSSLLLKAILANHVAFSDAAKTAKHAETSLKLKMDELEHERARLEVELHKKSNTTKRSKSATVSVRSSVASWPPPPRIACVNGIISRVCSRCSRVASPTASPSYIPNIASPLSRLGHSPLDICDPYALGVCSTHVPYSLGVYRPSTNFNSWLHFYCSPICDTCLIVIPFKYSRIAIPHTQVPHDVDFTTTPSSTTI